jgi:hypothetical protein
MGVIMYIFQSVVKDVALEILSIKNIYFL